MTIFGLNFLQKTANRDFVKILRFAVSVFLNLYCGSVLVRFSLDTLLSKNSMDLSLGFTRDSKRLLGTPKGPLGTPKET